jgi:hypothetical protein
MTDLQTRFRTLDDLSAPNLWNDIEERAMAMQPTRRSSAWVLIAVSLLLVLVIGGAVLVGTGVIKLPVTVDASASPSSVNPSSSAASSASVAPTSTPVPPAGWSALAIPGIDGLTGIAERDGRLVAVGTAGADQLEMAMAFSDDGQVWTAIDLAAFDLGAVGPASVFGGDPGFGAIAYRNIPGEGVRVPVYLFSADGETWDAATPPAGCTTVLGPVMFGQFGFVGLGEECRGEGLGPPGPLHILTSLNGRAWTSRIDEGHTVTSWATDGSRLVLLYGCGSSGSLSLSLTDDLGETWRCVESPFPAEVSVKGAVWGHDRYVADGSWLIRDGDPDSGSCVSSDGESWQCEIIAATGDLANRDNFLNPITVTPTGFISLNAYPVEPTGDSGLEMILGRSTDGLTWSFERVPELANRASAVVASTSHGVFVWGSTSTSSPYIDIYRAPLP